MSDPDIMMTVRQTAIERGNIMPEKNIYYYGKMEALPEVIPLRAGPLSLRYELGDLRYIRLGDHEILRRVYVAIRDHNWDTIVPRLSNIQMDVGADSFHITYDVENKRGDIDFFWQGIITGAADGTITCTMQGKVRSTFRRNRIGYCILHPMSCAGVSAKIEHIDGSIEECPFPDTIAPQIVKEGHPWPVAPFENMQSVSHEALPNLWAKVHFEGDIFEMEDQRNWTDASFKTYGTPLSLPIPVEVTAGVEISQSITLTLEGDVPSVSSEAENRPVTFSLNDEPGKAIPQIGLGVASHAQPLTSTELARLRGLNLSHLRVDLSLSDSTYKAKLQQATSDAQSLDISLEIALFLSNQAQNELTELATVLQVIQPPVLRWLIFHHDEKTTTAQWLDLTREHLSAIVPSVPVGAGTNVYFTELNAMRPPVKALDLVAYSINPQVHAFDNASLIETLEAQAITVKSARQIAPDRPLVVSPVTLLPRFNPNATGPEPAPEPEELPAQVDVRQMSLFGAGWTVGSLKYMLESDLQSVTYYETTGWRGVMETEVGSRLPDKFQSMPGNVFPLYHVLADVGELVDGAIISTASSNPLVVDGLAIHRADQMRVIVANLSNESQQVMLANLGSQAQVRYLDETNVVEAMQAAETFRAQAGDVVSTLAGELTLDLKPYAVARVDSQN